MALRAVGGPGLLVIGVAAVVAAACERERPAPRKQQVAPAPSGSALDGMQLFAARRVALESATAALEQRDIGRLKQLNVWVRHRATVPLLEPDDLKSLDLAIQCLEQVSPPADAVATLDGLKSGVLRKPARAACLARAAE